MDFAKQDSIGGKKTKRDNPKAKKREKLDDEIKELFAMGKKRKAEKSPEEIALSIETVLAELELAAEDDAQLNRRGKPAINKLMMLPRLTEVLSKKQLQHKFVDRGVMTLLKNWLEPLPDGSLPNINVREAVLKILADLPIDAEKHERRELLKKSGLGKVIMFLSKSDEETTSNRKLAKHLVDKWTRSILNNSTRFEDMKDVDNERVLRMPTARRPVLDSKRMEAGDGDLDLDFSRERKLRGQSSTARQLHVSRPKAAPLNFVVHPQSKINPEEVRAHHPKQVLQDKHQKQVMTKLQ